MTLGLEVVEELLAHFGGRPVQVCPGRHGRQRAEVGGKEGGAADGEVQAQHRAREPFRPQFLPSHQQAMRLDRTKIGFLSILLTDRNLASAHAASESFPSSSSFSSSPTVSLINHSLVHLPKITDMEAASQQQTTPLFTCISCSIAFHSAEDQSMRYLLRLFAPTYLLMHRGTLQVRPPPLQYEAACGRASSR